MAAIPVAHAGAASGLFRTGQQFGAALGMATLGGFYLAQSASAPDAWRGAFITLLTLGALILLAIAALSRLLPASVLPRRVSHDLSRPAMAAIMRNHLSGRTRL